MAMIVARPSGDPDSLMALPTLPLGNVVGDNLVLHNGGSANILLTSEETLPGSKLSMRSQQTTLEPKENITFGWDGQKWVETARSAAGSSNADVIAAADYGVSPENTRTVNNERMALAIAAAVAAGKELLLPSGRVLIDMHQQPVQSGGWRSPFPTTQSVVLRGAGREATTLVCDGWVEPTFSDPNTIVLPNDQSTAMFYEFGADVALKLKDLTIEGPPTADLVYGYTSIAAFYGAGGGSIRLENVRVTRFGQVIKMSPEFPTYPGTGTAFSADEDCIFEFRGLGMLTEGIGRRINYDAQTVNFTVGAVLTGGTSGAKAAIIGQTDAGATGTLSLKHLNGTFVDNETITDSAGGSATANGAVYGGGESVNLRGTKLRYMSELPNLITALPGISNARHALYISNGTSLRTIGCEFVSTGGTGGESGCAWRHYSVGDTDVPEYSESIGDIFAAECAAAIIPNPNFESRISSTIHSKNLGGNTAVQMPGPARFDGCHFVGHLGAFSAIADGAFSGGRATVCNTLFEGDWVYAISRGNGTADRWKIGPNVQIRTRSSQGGGGFRLLDGGMDFDGVVLDVQGAGTAGAGFLKGGSFRMANTRFATGCQPMVINATSALSVEYLPGNSKDDSTEDLIVPTAFNVVFSGLGRNFALSAAPAGTVSGSLQCQRGVGAYDYAAGRLRFGWGGDLFIIDVGGAPTIDNMSMSGSIAGGATSDDLNAPCQATVRLYVKQAFTLGAGGNIVAAGGARTVGDVVTLVYINTLATPKWVEVA